MDVIESPPPRIRWGLSVCLLAGATVVAIVLWALGRTPEPPPPSSTSASPAASQATYGFLPRFPKGQPPPADLAALVAPMRPPQVVDPASGTAIAVQGITVTLQGKCVVTELERGFLVSVLPGPNLPTEAYLVTGDLSIARHLVTAGVVAPGADGRSVLAATAATVTRLDLDGTKREEITLPPNRMLAQETIAGFLVSTVPQGAWEIWDPRSGEVRYRFPQLFAASGGKVAYGSYSRSVTVVDLATDKLLETEIPDRELAVHQAALSRDGRYLAAHLINRGQWQHLIAVLDTKLGLWYAMPGTPFAALNQLALGWSGKTLVLAYTTDQPAIALWTPGDTQVYSAAIK